MRVGVNAQLLSFAASYRSAGVRRYIWNLLAGLHASGAHDYTVYYPGGAVPAALGPRPGCVWRSARLPTGGPWGRLVWEQLFQPIEVWRDRVEVLHSPAYAAPLVSSARQVLTVHDLSFLRLPDAFNRANRLYLGMLTRLSARRADRIIAVSGATKADVVRLLGVAADRVHVVYNGVEPSFRPVSESALAEFRVRRGVVDEYVLYLGTLEPRKNVTTLLRAYARARQSGELRQRLVLAGGRGWRDAPCFQLVKELGIEDAVHFAGFVPFEDQPFWYCGASVFVYPSLLEGFGFPILEAMACGTPVIASNCSALPEVAGDAAMLVAPTEVDTLAAAIIRVVQDPGLADDLRSRGLRRATLFTWESSVARTISVYESARASV
ncbi:MAG: glycosyltransferase family 4 protein [Chloroflexi bacterium]|nr:glycosyltransferase family 4 protein [Chloroflexota bacterium]